MAPSMFFPLDNIQPSEILNQYSEWIYFTLVLVFFISLAGITLRRHFDKPYVKPLIVSVGLIMTVGVFLMREQITVIFEGWGILGSLLLVFIAATIPYGLCRGFGMSATRAFYLTYALFYILSWVKYPELYYTMADHNLGLVNLGLLILFIFAIYKSVRFKRSKVDLSKGLETENPLRKKIDHETDNQSRETRGIKRIGRNATRREIKTVEDIDEELADIHQIIETHKNNLPTEERNQIAGDLKDISKSEEIIMKGLRDLKALLNRCNILDEKAIQEMRNRMSKVSGGEKRIIEMKWLSRMRKSTLNDQLLAWSKSLRNGLIISTSS